MTGAFQSRSGRERGFLAAVRKSTLPPAIVLIASGIALWAARAAAPSHGLVGRYFDNDSWSGRPVTTVVDSSRSFDKKEILRRTAYAEPLSVLWDGYVWVPADSTYRFEVTSDDGSWVFIDGSLVIDNGGQHGKRTLEKTVPLARGCHQVQIKYFDAGGDGLLDYQARESLPSQPRGRSLAFFPQSVDARAAARDIVLSKSSIVLGIVFALAGILIGLILLAEVLRRRTLIPVGITIVFLVVSVFYEYAVFSKMSTAVEGCDSYAYLQGAEVMARRGFLRTEFTDPLIPLLHRHYETVGGPGELFLLSPHGHYVYDPEKGIVYNTFPPGTSMLLYPFVKMFGRASVFFVLPILNVILLGLFFYFGARLGGVVFGACLGAATMFSAQVFINSVYIMSDVPSMALVALSVFSLARNVRTPRLRWPLLAGASLGGALLVRYSNLAAIVPLAYLFWQRYRADRRWTGWARDLFAFGGAFFAFGLLPMAVYTYRHFGTIFRLVYDPYNRSQTSLANVPGGFIFYLKSLYLAFGWPGLLLMAAGLAALLARKRSRPVAFVCLSGLAAFLLFYMFQSIRHDRFLVPVYPFLGVFFGFGVVEIVRLFRKTRLLAFGLAAASLVWPLWQARANYLPGIRDADRVVRTVRQNVGPKAVVFCDQMSGPLRLYEDIPGYRFMWADVVLLKETLNILYDHGYELYFLIDSSVAEETFGNFLRREVFFRDTAHLQSSFFGKSLYRLLPKGAPER